MIDLMLQAGSHQPVGFDQMLFAICIEVIDLDGGWPFHFGIIIRYRKAAFLIGADFIRHADNLGIDEDMRRFRFIFLGKVDDEHADRFAYLNGGEANARRIIHGVEHVAGKFAQLVVKALHRLGNLAQDGIGKDDKRFYRHGLSRNGSRENRQLHFAKCSRFDLIKTIRIS